MSSGTFFNEPNAKILVSGLFGAVLSALVKSFRIDLPFSTLLCTLSIIEIPCYRDPIEGIIENLNSQKDFSAKAQVNFGDYRFTKVFVFDFHNRSSYSTSQIKMSKPSSIDCMYLASCPRDMALQIIVPEMAPNSKQRVIAWGSWNADMLMNSYADKQAIFNVVTDTKLSWRYKNTLSSRSPLSNEFTYGKTGRNVFFVLVLLAVCFMVATKYGLI